MDYKIGRKGKECPCSRGCRFVWEEHGKEHEDVEETRGEERGMR